MSIFIIYIWGLIISGMSFYAFNHIKTFHNFLDKKVNEAKESYKKESSASSMENSMVDGIENKSIINLLFILYTLLSWVGVILFFKNLIEWSLDK